MEREPHIPERLAGDLRRVYRGAVQVPGEVDARVLAAAAGAADTTELTKLRSVPPGRTPLRWRVAKWVGMAAAVFLALTVPTQLSNRSQRVVVAGDFNRDGVLDILDAFAVRAAQRDGDSSITQADIDAAANAAVRIRGGGA